MTDLINLRSVSAAYGKGQVLWDVALDMKAGEAATVLGRNGVGKTTLMKTIMGQLPVSGGYVYINGDDVTAMSAHQRSRAGIGFVPQGRHVFASLTVEENLRVAATEPEHHRRWREVYDLFPRLQERARHRASDLSGGEQQMLAIGRALVRRPRLLVLDEPTEGLAPRVVEQLSDALRELVVAEQLALLLLEQRIAFAQALCDRVAEMDGRGRLGAGAA